MKRVKVVYIASPYSNPDPDVCDYRERMINIVSARLHRKYDHSFILPITQSATMKRIEPSLGTSFEYWKDRDLTFIDVSDEVWVVKLEGWQESIGVKAEIEFALTKNKVVKYINPTTLRFNKD